MDKQNSQCRLRIPEEVRRQKRKELDARRSKCRIRIGSHLDQWCDLKEELGFSLHSQLAKFLLDSYSSSTGVLGTEQPNDGELPGSFSVTYDTLQQLIILCHGHSQDCEFLPNLKLITPQKRRGLVQALLWECLAGHTFSWSFSVSTSQNDAPQICPRTTDTPKNAQIEISDEQLSFNGSRRIPPVRRSRRLRSAVSSRKQTPIEMVQSSESTEAVTAPQNTFDSADCSSISISSEQRQEVSRGTTARMVAITGLCDSSYNNVHLSSEDIGVGPPGSWPSPGEQGQKRVTRQGQMTVSQQVAPAEKQRTEPTDVPAQSPAAVQEASAADSPTAAERMVLGNLSHSSEASAKDFLSAHCLSLEADEESAMPGFCTTPEGLQPEAAMGLSVEKSAEGLGQDMLRDGTESHEDPLPFIDTIQDENFQPPSHREKRHLEQSDKEQPQIVKKKVRKVAKKEIIQCDYEGCDKIFSNRQYLNHHKKYQHVNQYTFTCSDPKCGKSFNFKKHLKEHEKRHTDKRDFICEFCARAFRTSSNLVIHRRIHTGEKPLQCEICGVTCRQKASLNWHMKKHDADSFYLFSCDTCGKRFEKRDNVTAHKAKKHPGACMLAESQAVPVDQYDMSYWKPPLDPTTQLHQEEQAQGLEEV